MGLIPLGQQVADCASLVGRVCSMRLVKAIGCLGFWESACSMGDQAQASG